MTSYHGGKQRIGLNLAEIIYFLTNKLENDNLITIQGYCEPFCGMLGVYQHIPILFKDNRVHLTYKAGDVNESVIKMWQAAQKGWKPPTYVTQTEYDLLKNTPDSALKGYVGHQYSYGGQYFMGYAPAYGKTSDSTRASKNVQQIATQLNKVSFTTGNYTQFSNLHNYIIYCDPPYQNTSQRYKSKSFDNEDFWNWCRQMAQHNIVFVSSYNAPKDFIQIMSSAHKLTGVVHSNANKNRVEKLYVIMV